MIVTFPRSSMKDRRQPTSRLELIQDQFRYVLFCGGFPEPFIEAVVGAVGKIREMGVFGTDPATGLRLVEAELVVSWELDMELSMAAPDIMTSQLPGWTGHLAPEIRVTGRRLAEAIDTLGLTPGFWITLDPSAQQDPSERQRLRETLGLPADPPLWHSPPQILTEIFLDLREVHLVMQAAADKG
jgi:hypothetical protein